MCRQVCFPHTHSHTHAHVRTPYIIFYTQQSAKTGADFLISILQEDINTVRIKGGLFTTA